MLITQKISNSSIFPEVNRTMLIVGIIMNSDAATFELFYRIKYEKDNEDISANFSKEVPRWFLDNNQKMMLRDEKFQPIPNPDFEEKKDENGIITNEIERFMTKPAFDYIKELMLDFNVPLTPLISAYIIEEDNDGRFNF